MPMVGKRCGLLMRRLFFRCDGQGSGVIDAGGPVVCSGIVAAQVCLVGEAERVKPFILIFVPVICMRVGLLVGANGPEGLGDHRRHR
jgi:hypothetical protein